MYIIITSRNMIVSGSPFSLESWKSSIKWIYNVFLLFWWLNSNLLVSELFLFLQCSPIKLFCFDIITPSWSSRFLDTQWSKNCSSWVQPPGKVKYKTLAPTACSGTCWQCRWFFVSGGHVVDYRSHSPVSFFCKY